MKFTFYHFNALNKIIKNGGVKSLAESPVRNCKMTWALNEEQVKKLENLLTKVKNNIQKRF